MKVFVSILFGIIVSLSLVIGCFAQTAKVEDKTGVGLLAIGQDNLYLCSAGTGCFLAIGGGVDIARFEKVFKDKDGKDTEGKFSVALHGYSAFKVTGNNSSAIFGGSLNLDLVKLVKASGIEILIPNLTCVIGPAVGYDVGSGKAVAGGLINFSYTLD